MGVTLTRKSIVVLQIRWELYVSVSGLASSSASGEHQSCHESPSSGATKGSPSVTLRGGGGKKVKPLADDEKPPKLLWYLSGRKGHRKTGANLRKEKENRLKAEKKWWEKRGMDVDPAKAGTGFPMMGLLVVALLKGKKKPDKEAGKKPDGAAETADGGAATEESPGDSSAES
ncbi:MAG: hypothetical protein M1833_002442 [Piccolia ochrophora]|nr:MAG: hypothetical protein M1833_002442 [Piccolia ochrophora]